MMSRIDIIGQNGNDGLHYEGDKMELHELIASIKNWANERNLIKGSNPQAQYVKLIEEAGELAGNIARKRDVKDDIGDMIVVLTIIAAQHNLTIAQCVATAWDDIKDRKGKMIDGMFIKESDL